MAILIPSATLTPLAMSPNSQVLRIRTWTSLGGAYHNMKHLDGPHSTSNCLLSTGGCLASAGNSSEEINCITSAKTLFPNKATLRGSQWTQMLEGTLFNQDKWHMPVSPLGTLLCLLQPLNARGINRFPKLFHTVPDPGHPVLSGDWSVDVI